jgi:SAM-dependent methyltransferase
VAERYARRVAPERYSILAPDVWQLVQERQRALLGLFVAQGWLDLDRRRLVEVGCGTGGNLLEFLRMGFAPQHLTGLELLPDRHAYARAVLPANLALHLGDALQAPVAESSVDLVFQATVFSSLLDDAFQQQLAAAMWRWLRPGGAVIWYDFGVDNPRNPDVRGVPLARLHELFPAARIQASRRLTLAPPIARRVCRLHPALYGVFNALPLLRTHRLVWLGKSG